MTRSRVTAALRWLLSVVVPAAFVVLLIFGDPDEPVLTPPSAPTEHTGGQR